MKISRDLLSENFQFLEVKFSIYLNRRGFVFVFSFKQVPRKFAVGCLHNCN